MSKKNNQTIIITAGLIGLTTTADLALTSTYVSAEDMVDNISITVPVSCSMSGSGENSHTAEIANGLYCENIGSTSIKVPCNCAHGGGWEIYNLTTLKTRI